MISEPLYKDKVLDELAATVNVAQFVSYGPNLKQRFSRVAGLEPNYMFESINVAAHTLLVRSNCKSVNIRTYLPNRHQSQPFVYGLTDVAAIAANIIRLANDGLYTIVHETIDVDDTGVSAVLQNGMLEFSPGSTVRFTDEDNGQIATFTKEFGCKLLDTVYGLAPELDYPDTKRVEFSIHPKPLGWLGTRMIVWEIHDVVAAEMVTHNVWPTAFSRLIGDKAYGLLIAHLCGFKVPTTTVFVRDDRMDNFTFGEYSHTDEVWMRTCPREQVPGKFTTVRGWHNPYELMDDDDPFGTSMVSCLSQCEVNSRYSGAALSTDDGPLIEGVEGFGDGFMTGVASPIELPEFVYSDVCTIHNSLVNELGPVRFEWAHDGGCVWILQLHVGKSISSGRTIVPGNFENMIEFDVTLGLDHLHRMINTIADGFGITVRGNVGMSSHICDVLRKANIPSRLQSV